MSAAIRALFGWLIAVCGPAAQVRRFWGFFLTLLRDPLEVLNEAVVRPEARLKRFSEMQVHEKNTHLWRAK
jgi:hypothetical protein